MAKLRAIFSQPFLQHLLWLLWTHHNLPSHSHDHIPLLNSKKDTLKLPATIPDGLVGKEKSFQQADEGPRHLREGRVLSPPVRQVTGQERNKN